EIPIAWLSVLLFGSLAPLLSLGLPMAFCTGSLAVIFLFIFGTPAVLNMMPSRIFPFMTDYQLSAVPLFIFMAAILEKAGIIEELFDVIYKSLGALLIGSVFPGLLLSGMYVLYITARCYVNPSLGPALPIEERVNLREKFRLLRNTIAPILLILLVLGIIFFGVATPVEAAGI